jgi:DNA invertase Pin-like site-specific DNA recombinase
MLPSLSNKKEGQTVTKRKKNPKGARRVVSYLRASTADQDTAKNRADVLAFANAKGFVGRVAFVEERVSGLKSWRKRKLAQVVEDLKQGDILIVPELSRLGRSLVEVLEVLNVLTDKDVAVYSVKEAFQLNGQNIQAKVMRTMLGLFAEIERDLISARTKEGLAAARAKGVKLGRPKGPGKSKLDPYEPEIIALLKNGSKKNFVARRYGVTPATLTNWLKRHGLDKVEAQP